MSADEYVDVCQSLRNTSRQLHQEHQACAVETTRCESDIRALKAQDQQLEGVLAKLVRDKGNLQSQIDESEVELAELQVCAHGRLLPKGNGIMCVVPSLKRC